MFSSLMQHGCWFPILLSFAFVISALGSSPDCPADCKCHEDIYKPYGEVLTVSCYDLTEMPDLSVLLKTKMGKNLRLDEQSLKTVDKSHFPPGLNITVLNLSRNKGLRIAEDAFLNLGSSLKVLKLEAIDLPFNGTLTMLDSLFSLHELSLSYNNKHPYVEGAVQDIDIPILGGEVAKSITKLTLSFCGIRTLSATSLGDLRKLKELDLSNNWFTSVPDVIEYLPTLTFLELFYCNIEKINDYDFSKLKHLKALDLSSNRGLSTIEPKAFVGCKDSLEKLVLARCNLTEVPSEALKDLTKLIDLDLSENQYASIGPGAFEGAYKLKTLLISAPNMEFDDDMFRGQEDSIDNLSILRMDMTTIPREILGKLSKLSRLSFDHNKITALPEKAFEGIKASVLYLGYNPLSRIDPMAFDGLPPNLDINLRGTEMDNIDFLLDYPETAIATVDLTHSKLVCRCSMKSSLNATLNIRLYGSCQKGNETVHISSHKLETILDEACEEERAAANSGMGVGKLVTNRRLNVLLGLLWATAIYFQVDFVGVHLMLF